MSAPARVLVVPTLRELASVLSGDPDVQLVGGGTLAVPSWQDRPGPRTVVPLRRIAALRYLDSSRAGAATTLAEVAQEEQVPAALRQAAASVGGPAVRAMATVGGNVAAAAPGCVAVAMLALRARACLLRPGPGGGLHEVPVAAAIGRDVSVITGFSWPDAPGLRSSLGKVMIRAAGGPVIATVAAACADSRPGTVAIGGPGMPPRRLPQAESAWRAARPQDAAELAAEAADLELRSAPGPGSDSYRRAVVATLVRRAITSIYSGEVAP